MGIRIYHNPRCSNSRKALALLAEHNAKVEIIEYMKNPPSKETLNALAKKMSAPKTLLRAKEPLAKELSLLEAEEQSILEAIATYPVLLNRPVIETKEKAIVARPPELVEKLL